MPVKKGKTTKGKAKTLAARPVSGKRADGVKGGTDSSGSSFKTVALGLRKSSGGNTSGTM